LGRTASAGDRLQRWQRSRGKISAKLLSRRFVAGRRSGRIVVAWQQ
jgi:hypothetical protein